MAAVLFLMFYFSTAEFWPYTQTVLALRPASEMMKDYLTITDADRNANTKQLTQEGYMAVAEIDWKHGGLETYRQLAKNNPGTGEFHAGLMNAYLKLHFQGNEKFTEAKDLLAEDLSASMNMKNSYFCYVNAYFLMDTHLVKAAQSMEARKDLKIDEIIILVKTGTTIANCDTYLLQRRQAVISLLKRKGMPGFMAKSFILKDKTTGEMLFRLSEALKMFAGQYRAQNDPARAEETYKLILAMTADVKKNCIDYTTFRRCIMIEQGVYRALSEYYRGLDDKNAEFYSNREASVKEVLKKDDDRLGKIDIKQYGILDANLSFAPLAFLGNSMRLQTSAYEIFFGLSLICMLVFIYIVSFIYAFTERKLLNAVNFDFPQVKMSWGLPEIFFTHAPFFALFTLYLLYNRSIHLRGLANDGRLAIMQAELISVIIIALTVCLISFFTGRMTRETIKIKERHSTLILKICGGITIMASAIILFFMPAEEAQIVGLSASGWTIFYAVLFGGIALLMAGYLTGHFSTPPEMRMLKRFRSWLSIKSMLLVLTVTVVVMLILHLLVIQQNANSLKNSYENQVLERILRNEVEMTNLESLREF